VHFLSLTTQSILATIAPESGEKVIGIISATSTKNAVDPMWADDKGVQDFLTFRKSYYPEIDPNNRLAADGYALAQGIFYFLQKGGDNLTRENIMNQAASMHGVEFPLLMPGVKVSGATGKHYSEYYPRYQRTGDGLCHHNLNRANVPRHPESLSEIISLHHCCRAS
jgi:branched-chain amino acid transport system substrate-binding protein